MIVKKNVISNPTVPLDGIKEEIACSAFSESKN